MSTVYGNIITGAELETAAITTLKTWLHLYLEEVADQLNLPANVIAPPRTYDISTEFEGFPEDQLPMILVVSPGLAEPPLKDGEGVYRAQFLLGIAAVVSAADEASTKNLSKIYGASIRATILQKRSLGGIANEVIWLDESYDDLPEENQRTLAAAQVIFRVGIDDVVTAFGGPFAPPDPSSLPGADWPLIDDVIIDFLRKEDQG